MNAQETPGPKGSNRNILLAVAALNGGLLCCGIAVPLLYLAWVISANLAPRGVQPPATLFSLEESNSLSPLGRFYFGLGSPDGSCRVSQQTDEFSQEDILTYGVLSISAPFDSQYEGGTIDWFVYDMDGNPVDAGKRTTIPLNSDQANCLEVLLFLNPRIEPGQYVLAVTYEGALAYRELFSITPSDLDKVRRPTRKPFSDFTLGRLVESSTCTAGEQSGTYPLSGLQENPWFYIVSPFQLGDLDKKLYWSVQDSRGETVFPREQRIIVDNIDLCFWQGFTMRTRPAGVYTVVVEDDKGLVIFQKGFEIK